MQANTVYKYLAPAKNISEMTIVNQSTRDIIQQVLDQHKLNVKQAKKIVHLFDTGEVYGTCQNIWNFLKYEVPYKVEPNDRQSTKTLSRIVYDAVKGSGNDCKHYSGFTGAILGAAGYPFKYRFAGYSKYSPYPTHVYVVAGKGSNEVICDAVINGFDIEKPYTNKIDKNMSLYKLSGFEDQEIGSLKSKLKQASKFVSKKAKQAGGAIKETAQKIKQGTLTVSLAIPRNAFLVLLRFNVHGWATGLKKMGFNQLGWWKDIGGNRTELMKVIEQGAKNARILGLDNNDQDIYGALGEPVTITSALVSASPILVKVASVLDKAESLSKTAADIKDKVNQTKADIQKAANGFKNLTGKSLTDIVFKTDAGQTGNKTALDSNDFKPTTDATAIQAAKNLTGGGSKNIILFVGFGLLAGVILLKKHK